MSSPTANSTNPLVLLFDIDGTLIDSAGAGGEALGKALRIEFGAEFGVEQVRRVELHGRTDCGILSDLLTIHGIPDNAEYRQRLCDRYYQLLPAELASRPGTVLPGVQDILQRVSTLEACLVGILTGNMPRSAQTKLEHFQLWEHFEFGIYGDTVPHRPMLRDVALMTVAEQCGSELPGERIVIIGDTPLDVALAKAMGSRCLAVCTGGCEASTLREAGADFVIDDLSDAETIVSWLMEKK